MSTTERVTLLALFKEMNEHEARHGDLLLRGTPSEHDLFIACQTAARRFLLMLDFDGPVVRGDPQRRQLVAEVAALVEHYASLRSLP
jgi:hypothetical protein